MRRFSLLSRALAVATLATAGIACDDFFPPTGGGDDEVTLLECPVETSQTASGILSPLGSTVSVGGTSITVPAGAVSVPVPVMLTLPASRYMEVQINVAGLELERFDFLLPVRVTIDYSRCERSRVLWGPLEVWYIDDDSKAPLEEMDIVSDRKLEKRITFSSSHLSSYAIAH